MSYPLWVATRGNYWSNYVLFSCAGTHFSTNITSDMSNVPPFPSTFCNKYDHIHTTALLAHQYVISLYESALWNTMPIIVMTAYSTCTVHSFTDHLRFCLNILQLHRGTPCTDPSAWTVSYLLKGGIYFGPKTQKCCLFCSN